MLPLMTLFSLIEALGDISLAFFLIALFLQIWSPFFLIDEIEDVKVNCLLSFFGFSGVLAL